MDKLVKVKENKVAISLRNNSSDTILFRLERKAFFDNKFTFFNLLLLNVS